MVTDSELSVLTQRLEQERETSKRLRRQRDEARRQVLQLENELAQLRLAHKEASEALRIRDQEMARASQRLHECLSRLDRLDARIASGLVAQKHKRQGGKRA